MPTLLPAQSRADSRIANTLAACQSLVIHHPITCQVCRFGKIWEGHTPMFGSPTGLDGGSAGKFLLLFLSLPGRFGGHEI
jgi:hypothetical protein